MRQHYISTLLWDSPVRPSLPAQLQKNIEWRSPESYLTNLAAVIAEQQSLFSYTAYRLRQQNLLSESESPSTRPRLQITTHDVRSSRDTPLPVLAPLPENVTVESN